MCCKWTANVTTDYNSSCGKVALNVAAVSCFHKNIIASTCWLYNTQLPSEYTLVTVLSNVIDNPNNTIKDAIYIYKQHTKKWLGGTEINCLEIFIG